MDWIEKLAREHGTGGWQSLDDMVRFGMAVAAAERESLRTEITEKADEWDDRAEAYGMLLARDIVDARSNAK